MEIKNGEKDHLNVFYKNTIPLSVHFELTNACNLSCRHCLVEPGKSNLLTLKEVFSCLDQFAELGVLEVSFSGGEPMLRTDIFEIIGYADKKGFGITFFSNLNLFNADDAKKLKNFQIKEVRTSIYGASASTHDLITMKNGSFDKTVNAVKLLVKEGVNTIASTTVMKQNLGEIKETGELVSSLGATFLINPLIFPCTDGSKKPLDMRLSDEDLTMMMFGSKEQKKENNESRETIKRTTGMCSAGLISCTISPEGEVYPCVGLRLKVGNMKHQKFKDFWHTSETLYYLRNLKDSDFKECYKCGIKKYCVKCPGLAYSEQGDLLAPPRECCRIAKIRAKGGVNYEERIQKAGAGQA